VLRFLDDNDTGARFLTRHGPAVTRLAATLLFALEGLPTIFTGDDVGAEYKPYETEGPIDWNRRHGLFSHYRRLIALRSSRPALREGLRSPVSGSPDPGVLAFRRVAGRESILAVFNFTRQVSHLTLGPDETGVPPVDLLSGRVIPLSGGGRLKVPAGGALLLVAG
jgi:cyclomaltodextrinase / maltogenic alpha-amylase / neopullulanase